MKSEYPVHKCTSCGYEYEIVDESWSQCPNCDLHYKHSIGEQKLKDECLQLRIAVEYVEWVELDEIGIYAICPWCKNERGEGHKQNCIRQIVLKSE